MVPDGTEPPPNTAPSFSLLPLVALAGSAVVVSVVVAAVTATCSALHAVLLAVLRVSPLYVAVQRHVPAVSGLKPVAVAYVPAPLTVLVAEKRARPHVG